MVMSLSKATSFGSLTYLRHKVASWWGVTGFHPMCQLLPHAPACPCVHLIPQFLTSLLKFGLTWIHSWNASKLHEISLTYMNLLILIAFYCYLLISLLPFVPPWPMGRFCIRLWRKVWFMNPAPFWRPSGFTSVGCLIAVIVIVVVVVLSLSSQLQTKSSG